MLTEMLDIVLTPKILGLPEIGGPRLKPFWSNGKSVPDLQVAKFPWIPNKFTLPPCSSEEDGNVPNANFHP